MAASPRRVASLMFGSGFAALVYQTAWQREFRLTFGASTAASAAVFGIFLGGLGLGSWLLGSRAERSRGPLSMYGQLEIAIALLAMASPLLLDAGTHAYNATGGSGKLGTALATSVRLAICAAVIGPAVILMGGTLPAAARAVEVETDASRRLVATLYAANTAGAVLGALVGTLVLFETLGTRVTLWAAALVNLLVGVTARSLGRDVSVPRGGMADAKKVPGASPMASPLVYAVAGVVGFVFLLMELVWYRMLAPLLGGTTFTFGIILGVALAGVGAGGYAYALAARRVAPSRGMLALSLALEALTVAAPLWLGDDLAELTALIRPAATSGFAWLTLSWLLVCGVVVLPTSLIAGFQFPLIVALLGSGRARVARQIGLAYAFNTLGAIAGALLGGFLLIPGVGAVSSWRVSAVLLLACSAATLAPGWRRDRRRWVALTAAVALVAALFASSTGPSAIWRHTPIGVGYVQLRGLGENERQAWRNRTLANMLWERDGVESAVGVSATTSLALAVNGKLDGTALVDRGTQAMLGVLPGLLHPTPRRTFIVGLGTGMTAGWLSTVPGVEHVRVAELEPAILQVADELRRANQDVLRRDNVEIVAGDGRELLVADPSRYDIIISEPSNPYRAGVAALFTVDFYEAAERRLADGGLFAQWMQGYDVDTATLLIVLKTLGSVFPYVEAWTPSSLDFVFIASRTPLVHDTDRLDRLLSTPVVRDTLRRTWLVEDVAGVFSHFLATDALIDELTADETLPMNTDDLNVLEYAFARSVEHRQVDRVFELMLAAERVNQHLPLVRGPLDRSRALELRHRGWNVSGAPAPTGLGYTDEASAHRGVAVQAGCLGSPAEVLPHWATGRGVIRDVVERFAVAQGLAHAGRPEALDAAAWLESQGYLPEARLIEARHHARAARLDAATDALVSAYESLRDVALPLCETAQQAIALAPEVARTNAARARLARALMHAPFAAHARDEARRQTAQQLAHASGDAALCMEAMGRNLDTPWWTAWFLELRAECTARASHAMASRAARDLELFRSRAAR